MATAPSSSIPLRIRERSLSQPGERERWRLVPLWSFAARDKIEQTSIISDADGQGRSAVLIGVRGNGLLALDGRSGKLLWRRSVPGALTPLPAILDLDGDGRLEIVVSAVGGDCVTALRAGNGKMVWSTSFGRGTASSPALGDLDDDGGPDLVIGVKHAVIALHGATGALLWELRSRMNVHSSPCVVRCDGDGEVVVIVKRDDMLEGLRGRNGARLWSFPATALTISFVETARTSSNKDPMVVASVGGGKVVALCVRTGTLIWSQEVLVGDPRPVVCDVNGDSRLEVVFSSSHRHLYVLDASSGTILWKFIGEESFVWGQRCGIADVLGKGRPQVIAASVTDSKYQHGLVYILDGASGASLVTLEMDSDTEVAPLVGDLDGDGRPEIVVGSDRGSVCAFAVEPA